MVCNRFPTDWSSNMDAGGTGGTKRPADGTEAASCDAAMEDATPALEVKELSFCYGGGATFHDRALSEPKLVDVSCVFGQGNRVLVSGANGAGKSTLLSIMGGKMLPRGKCLLLGKDRGVPRHLPQPGADVLRGLVAHQFLLQYHRGGADRTRAACSRRASRSSSTSPINLSWRINAISDGQRRRCQLLECLAEEKKVYVLDEITTDLDLYAREGLLDFLNAQETETKGATVFYATHIFDPFVDSLSSWATHCLHFTKGRRPSLLFSAVFSQHYPSSPQRP
ncbi:unnamed protein product [Prorocentrum cordatum]|uniref:ABC transporter domain-containing protein n=1 Tax=Prorocentrum cordatum TaxID=2364126 RepID=A0ABN9XS58_9DINO|nr:unnamed protein product [Polarella glacialis]